MKLIYMNDPCLMCKLSESELIDSAILCTCQMFTQCFYLQYACIRHGCYLNVMSYNILIFSKEVILQMQYTLRINCTPYILHITTTSQLHAYMHTIGTLSLYLRTGSTHLRKTHELTTVFYLRDSSPDSKPPFQECCQKLLMTPGPNFDERVKSLPEIELG